MATTYNNLYLDLRTELRRAGDEEATQSARELVCAAAAKTREELVRDGSLYASPEVEKSARELVKRHLAGEPVAYLIGEWEFYGLPLDISEQVLIPRSDTEVLAGEAIRWLQTQQVQRDFRRAAFGNRGVAEVLDLFDPLTLLMRQCNIRCRDRCQWVVRVEFGPFGHGEGEVGPELLSAAFGHRPGDFRTDWAGTRQ